MRAYIHAFRGNPWNEECQAAKIAIDTAKRFAVSRPGRLDVMKWVLFDDKMLEVYGKEMMQMEVKVFDNITEIVRDDMV